MPSNLTSRQSLESYGKGRFELSLQTDGNLVLYSVSMPTSVRFKAYWASGTLHKNSTLVFDKTGHLSIKEGTTTIFNITQDNLWLTNEDFYYLYRIDNDGVFRQYNHPKKAGCNNLNWTILQRIPQDICSAMSGDTGGGACGYNSYCVTINGEPDCLCPEGYSFLDPPNKNKGCKPDFPLPSCQATGWEARHELVEFKELRDTDWPSSDYDLQIGNGVDKQTCIQLCREDCFCAAAISDGNRTCWKKKYPLSSGGKSMGKIALIKHNLQRNLERKGCSASQILPRQDCVSRLFEAFPEGEGQKDFVSSEIKMTAAVHYT
ncbi:G-type lectin S-receptor-like serine/threonine-protein kinase RLK1 [Tripterygium wilfordii]|uniref:G-type lectin S-receptor-like serine/threonine-protein kinase RLK1 n=1 Tax=Tripterygium wilfordii TaxID=458696 RepID=A0A7J7CQL1_TRIWF|nr:G-type lectin S-receptor-like serine/threonine-protein kinase RLK1 [Tripterygium wilfordii]